MAVGLGKSREDIDYRAGNLVLQIRNNFEEIQRFRAFLNTMPDADLQAPPYNYTSNEVAQLKSSFADLDQLRQIFEGSQSLSSAKDFMQFAKLLTGVL